MLHFHGPDREKDKLVSATTGVY